MDFEVIMNEFARRQSPGSGYSYPTMPEPELVRKTSLWMAQGLVSAGYRDGVVLVNVPQNEVGSFVSCVCAITEETPLVATFEARRDGELQEQVVRAAGKPMVAGSCQIVLYRNDVLGNSSNSSLDSEVWEIVSINASPTLSETPISPTALIRNHLGLPGGTSSEMTDEEFVDALRASVEFWRNHALLQPGD